MKRPIPTSNPTSPDPGSFRPDGSWDRREQPRTPCYAFVRHLRQQARSGRAPDWIAAEIATLPFPSLLGSCGPAWVKLHSVADWPDIWCSTSAARTIKTGAPK